MRKEKLIQVVIPEGCANADEAFEKYTAQFDLDGDQWIDRGSDDIFKDGFEAGLRAQQAPGVAAPVFQAFRDALAWGMVYGPRLVPHQWEEMRDKMATQFAENIETVPVLSEEAIKAAYWNFDARVKGLPPHKAPCGQPEHAFVVSVLEAVGAQPAVAVPDCFMRLYQHARGLLHGIDWNAGTQAGHHRQAMVDATRDCEKLIVKSEITERTNREVS